MRRCFNQKGAESILLPFSRANFCLQADLDLRKTLYSNIVLSGGSTLFPGFGDRLLHEVKRLAPKEVKIKISCYLFAAQLASLIYFTFLLLQKESTLHGLEDRFSLLSTLSEKCGYLMTNTMRMVQISFTAKLSRAPPR